MPLIKPPVMPPCNAPRMPPFHPPSPTRYEGFHGVGISEAAVMAAATLSARYISGRFLPDKAIDLMDEATAQVREEERGGRLFLPLQAGDALGEGQGGCTRGAVGSSNSFLEVSSWRNTEAWSLKLAACHSLSLPILSALFEDGATRSSTPPSPHLQVKMELTLKPEALDNVDRKIVQLEMEAHSLKPKVWGSVDWCWKGEWEVRSGRWRWRRTLSSQRLDMSGLV